MSVVAGASNDQSARQSWIDDDGMRAEDVFRGEVRKVLADGVVTHDEKAQLEAMRLSFAMTVEAAKRIFDEEKARATHQQPSEISTVDTNKLGKLLQLASRASESGAHQEAYDLYSKALEEDPQSFHACFGKGKSAGWLSTLENLRLSEMAAEFHHACQYAPSEVKEELARKAAWVIAEVSMAHFEAAQSVLEQFSSSRRAWAEFLGRALVAKSGLLMANEILSEPAILKKCIIICNACIRGTLEVSVETYYLKRISAAEEKAFRSEIDNYARIIQSVEPDYKPPEVHCRSSLCFVATAAMGDSNHPCVCLLREFRDTWLVHWNWGQVFIAAYWRIGPWLAKRIQGRPLRQAVVRILIIRPACFVAKWILSGQRGMKNRWRWGFPVFPKRSAVTHIRRER